MMPDNVKPMPSRKASTPLFKNDEEINGILPMIEDLIMLGANEADILEAMGYSRKSRKALTRLRQRYPQLDAAFRTAKLKLGGKITNALLECAIGTTSSKITTKRDSDGNIISTTEEVSKRAPNVNAIAMVLATRFPEFGWTRKGPQEKEPDIFIEEANMQVVSKMSNDELLETLQTLEEKIRRDKLKEQLVEASYTEEHDDDAEEE
jgi:hypothetical protein